MILLVLALEIASNEQVKMSQELAEGLQIKLLVLRWGGTPTNQKKNPHSFAPPLITVKLVFSILLYIFPFTSCKKVWSLKIMRPLIELAKEAGKSLSSGLLNQ